MEYSVALILSRDSDTWLLSTDNKFGSALMEMYHCTLMGWSDTGVHHLPFVSWFRVEKQGRCLQESFYQSWLIPSDECTLLNSWHAKATKHVNSGSNTVSDNAVWMTNIVIKNSFDIWVFHGFEVMCASYPGGFIWVHFQFLFGGNVIPLLGGMLKTVMWRHLLAAAENYNTYKFLPLMSQFRKVEHKTQLAFLLLWYRREDR